MLKGGAKLSHKLNSSYGEREYYNIHEHLDRLISQQVPHLLTQLKPECGLKTVSKLEKLKITRHSLSNRRVGLEAQERNISPNKELRREQKRSILKPCIPISAALWLPRSRLSYIYTTSFTYILTLPCICHRRLIILGVNINKVNRLKETVVLPHHLRCLRNSCRSL